MVSAALNGELDKVNYTPHPIFKVLVPEMVPGVPHKILDPQNTWDDAEAYELQAQELARRFLENFKKFADARREIVEAGPNA
jgi:phosphoenolpyruvate carboxykinase (ATP)